MNRSNLKTTIKFSNLIILVVLLAVSTACQSSPTIPTNSATPDVIQIGPLRLTHDPTMQEQRLSGTPPPTPQEMANTPNAQQASLQEQEATTLAEARKLAGYDILSPSYLPSGYTLQRYTVLVAKDTPAQEVSAEYISSDYKQLFYLRQIPYSAKDTNNILDFPVGKARVAMVKVRGQDGVWVEATNQGAHQTDTGEEVLVPWNMLLWVDGDYFFWLYSSELTLEENLKVAESLTAATH
ncbi:MAG TPA: DUF4367 domain-containing protein [Anaerolineales bacterium]|nr:DUF4367 domain-containing protein [Anaerolineales bacterium]